MKRFFALILVLLSLTGTVYADTIDLSGMTYEELVSLKNRINLAIWNSQEWQEVTVPQGVWKIGRDIPAGHWTIRMIENTRTSWCGLTYCTELDETGLEGSRKGKFYIYKQLARPGSSYSAALQIDIELKDGTYLIIDNSDVIFTPFYGKPSLGFK